MVWKVSRAWAASVCCLFYERAGDAGFCQLLKAVGREASRGVQQKNACPPRGCEKLF